jgi:hypothetical protein
MQNETSGFSLNLDPLKDGATATISLDNEEIEISIKELWEATGEPKSLVTDQDAYIEELKPFMEKIIGKELSTWSVQVLYNAVTNWVTELYKKK